MSETPWLREGRIVYQLGPDGRGEMQNRWWAHVQASGPAAATPAELEEIVARIQSLPSMAARIEALEELCRELAAPLRLWAAAESEREEAVRQTGRQVAREQRDFALARFKQEMPNNG